MKESYREGIASHSGPESCTVNRKVGGEALTGVHSGWVLSRVMKFDFEVPTQFFDAEGNTGRDVIASHVTDLARSETPCMSGTISHGNREIPRSSAPKGGADRIGKSKDAHR